MKLIDRKIWLTKKAIYGKNLMQNRELGEFDIALKLLVVGWERGYQEGKQERRKP